MYFTKHLTPMTALKLSSYGYRKFIDLILCRYYLNDSLDSYWKRQRINKIILARRYNIFQRMKTWRVFKILLYQSYYHKIQFRHLPTKFKLFWNCYCIFPLLFFLKYLIVTPVMYLNVIYSPQRAKGSFNNYVDMRGLWISTWTEISKKV